MHMIKKTVYAKNRGIINNTTVHQHAYYIGSLKSLLSVSVRGNHTHSIKLDIKNILNQHSTLPPFRNLFTVIFIC